MGKKESVELPQRPLAELIEEKLDELIYFLLNIWESQINMNFGVYVVKTINIRCKSAIELDLDELHVLQKDLKSLSKEDYEKYKNEIIETGYAFPIKAWKDAEDNWQIVGGTQSYRTLLQMRDIEGYVIPKIPVSIIEADNLRQACHRVLQDASNYGKVEKEGLYEFMQMASLSIDELKDRFDPTDIDMEEFEQEFFNLEQEMTGQSDEDEIPEQVEAKTKLGDLYQLGDHRLICGDSSDPEVMSKLMQGEKAELVFTDPPYRMEVEGGSNQIVGQAARKLGEAIAHLCDFDPNSFLKNLPSVFPDNKMNAYIFCNKDLVPDYLDWGKKSGYSFNILFWKKPNAIPLGGSHRPDVEYLLLFRRSATWNNGLSDVNYSKCLEFGRELSEDHPTIKPVALIKNEIAISSSLKGNVIDFFGGSGSTLIACETLNRRAFLCEIEPKYCDVIIARWEKFTGKTAIKL